VANIAPLGTVAVLALVGLQQTRRRKRPIRQEKEHNPG